MRAYTYKQHQLQRENTITEGLVRLAGNGDIRARSELYRLYIVAMYNHCLRITADKKDAEDALHDAFLYAFDHLHQLQTPAAFGGWLRRIVTGYAIRVSHKGRSVAAWDETLQPMDTAEEEPWWLDIPLQTIHEAIKGLPHGCRQVFVLFVGEDYSHKEIAASLGISESTSKSQYQRARKLLKEILSGQKTNAWMNSKNI